MDEKRAAEHIYEFFARLSEDFIEVQDKWLDYDSSEFLPVISEESVEKKLKGLSVRKVNGPYDPSMTVLKMFARNFAIPLTKLKNCSGHEYSQKFGNVYNVCAIPKVTPCSAVEDLMRPISLTSALSKIHEGVVRYRMDQSGCRGECQ
jgi:hypothetical protein